MNIKIALVGYGGMGRYHLRRLKRIKGYQVAGIYDIDPDKLERAKKAGYHTFQSAQEIIEDTSVDAVLIATPNDSHVTYVELFAPAKKHILCEKPVSLNVSELERMIKATINNSIVFTVNQNRRYDRDFLTIKKIHDEALLGNVYKIESNVMGSHGIPGDWRKNPEQGGGMILDWGIHLVDQALQMIPAKVKSVFCKTFYVYGHEVDDGCKIFLEFENGVEYYINIETNAYISLPRWQVYGLDGTGIIKNWLLQGHMKKVKVFFDKKNKGIKAGNGLTKTMAYRSSSTVFKTRLPRAKGDKNSIYTNFLNAVHNGEPLIVKHDEQLRLMKILEVAFLSAEKNQVIKLDTSY